MGREVNEAHHDVAWRYIAVATGLPGPAHAVKPSGTTARRTSGRDSAMCGEKARNNRDVHSKKFRRPVACDGPRSGSRPSVGAGCDNECGSGATVPGDSDDHAPSGDSGWPPATATSAARPRSRQRYSIENADERGRTSLRTPSISNDAVPVERGTDLDYTLRREHAEWGPGRTCSRKVKSRTGVAAPVRGDSFIDRSTYLSRYSAYNNHDQSSPATRRQPCKVASPHWYRS